MAVILHRRPQQKKRNRKAGFPPRRFGRTRTFADGRAARLAIEIAVPKKIPLKSAQLLRLTKKILACEQVRDADLSLAFVSDPKSRLINRKFLGHDYPTDVLAFDFGPDKKGSTFNVQRSTLTGEIIISADTAARQARQFHTTPQHELVLYLVHGILHLRGYDDHRPQDIKRMRAREKKVMARLGYAVV